ncbi:LysR family transcriptional regulator [Saccharibacillus qingshengii]|uniref:LysR family transcriptional regulator n=1 Tax=Saccharibacillus qingshengii TaxID=1763540 RepID=UPI001557DCDA|nr:LysR family transcriptional regulator [Saccharibacillus qingshengii]
MELLQLQYLMTVARLEHMTEAAHALHVTQSSLSKTIRRLEEDLGVPLFDRTGRRLRLNESGKVFVRRAEKALFELEQGRREVQDLSDPAEETVKLAVTAGSRLPAILSEFRKRRPGAKFHVQMQTTREMQESLQRNEVDFALSSPPVQGAGIGCRIVHRDPLILAVPEGHHLAGRPSIELVQLKGESLVGVKKGYGTRDLVDQVCRSKGISLDYVYEGDEPTRLLALVEAGIGLAILPETARGRHESVCYLRLEEADLSREIALLWTEGRYHSQAAEQFRTVVLEHFKKMTEER